MIRRLLNLLAALSLLACVAAGAFWLRSYNSTEQLTWIRPDGVLVNTTVWIPAPSDDKRSVRGINLFVRSDAEQLSRLVAMVDRGELRVDVAERVPLAELPLVHAKAAAGALPGKVVVLPSG